MSQNQDIHKNRRHFIAYISITYLDGHTYMYYKSTLTQLIQKSCRMSYALHPSDITKNEYLQLPAK